MRRILAIAAFIVLLTPSLWFAWRNRDMPQLGEGHDDATWTALLAAIRAAGHDGTVSIEHEDPRYGGAEGVERSLAGLRRALAALP